MKRTTLYIFFFMFLLIVTNVNAGLLSNVTMKDLFWFNDTVTNINTAVDYGVDNNKMNNKTATSNIISTDCAANYTNCGYGATGRWETDIGNTIKSYQNITIFAYVKPTADETTGDLFFGNANTFRLADTGTQKYSLRFGPNATIYNAGSITYNLNDWLLMWGYQFENATGWFACSAINNSLNETCIQTNGNFSSPTWDDIYVFNNVVSGYIQVAGVINYTINQTDRECIYAQILEGNRTMICEDNSSIPITPSSSFNKWTSVGLNLTFDNSTDFTKDTSVFYQNFTPNNANTTWLNSTYCKWYGCVNLSNENNDYLNGTLKTNISQMSISFWIYNTRDTGASVVNYFGFGSDSLNQLKVCEEQSYGMYCKYDANGGLASIQAGSDDETSVETWTNYFIIYNTTNMMMYKNSVLINGIYNFSYGDLNYTLGESLFIGKGPSTSDMVGYLDEFVMWNHSNFTQEDISTYYNEMQGGTPPNKDLYVKNITANMLNGSFLWGNGNNTFNSTGELGITFEISNYGTNQTQTFTWNVTCDSANLCGYRQLLNAKSSVIQTCNLSRTVIGYKKCYISIDSGNEVDESDETNNIFNFYVPMMDGFLMHTNLSELNSTIFPYDIANPNTIAGKSYSWFETFLSEDFSTSYDCDSVDPRGKKGRENGISCVIDYYDPTSTQCIRARNHLNGWSNISAETCTNVQSLHELAHVGFLFDMMRPNLTQQETTDFLTGLYPKCQKWVQLGEAYNDDTFDLTHGGNGWGFGSGGYTLCYAINGLYADNPFLISEYSDNYNKKSIMDIGFNREQSYLSGMKNDSESQYQEGFLYKTYSQYHIVENLLFEQKYGFNNITYFDNAYCAMAKEDLRMLLDKTYSGRALRNDETNMPRWISRGDTNSYQDISDGSVIGYGIITAYGLLCSQQETSQITLWLRNNIPWTSTQNYSLLDVYTYNKLNTKAVTAKTPEQNGLSKFSYDKANEIFYLRSNYSYINDTVIQIDGGEERGGGHSQAQGYFLYYNGEPFLDYEQVPYEDDTRMENFKNGISLQNDMPISQGQNGWYSETCGNAELNQYYGMSDCSVLGSYPNYRIFPYIYGGTVEDYIGTQDANFGGVFVYRPYKNSNGVKEYFIKYGDNLVKRSIVLSSSEGERIYNNFINIKNETTGIVDGLNFTFNRTNNITKINGWVNTQLVYSNQTIQVSMNDTNVSLCFAKTDCTSSNKGNSNYRRTVYETIQALSLDIVFNHHMNTGDSVAGVTSINTTEKGITDGNNNIYFDGNNDGKIYTASAQTDGWGLVYNTVTKEYGCFNCTKLNTSAYTAVSTNSSTRFHIKINPTGSKAYFTINTYESIGYIDGNKPINVTINTQEFTTSENLEVTKNSVIIPSTKIGNTVFFISETSQNSDEYVITGSGTDTTAPTISTPTVTVTNTSGYISISADENINLSLVVLGNTATNLTETNLTNLTVQNPNSVKFINLVPVKTYYYNLTYCDVSGNCARSGVYNFTTSANTAADETAPSIVSVVESGVTTSSFIVTLTLNESGNASIWYGLSAAALNTEIKDTAYSVSHAFLLSSLTNNTKYYYLLNGTDEYNNRYQSSVYDETTSQTTTPDETAIQATCREVGKDGLDGIIAFANLLNAICILLAIRYMLMIAMQWFNGELTWNSGENIKDLMSIGFLIFVLTIISIAVSAIC